MEYLRNDYTYVYVNTKLSMKIKQIQNTETHVEINWTVELYYRECLRISNICAELCAISRCHSKVFAVYFLK